MSTSIEADYLVVGSGAMGMAFTDVLLNETKASVVMVDRHHQPGGHWNDAYPYVRLHQPSAFYGVNSKKLGSDTIDATGWNQGLYELATNSEVCAYFDQVMQQSFLASGRVRYFPMCEYQGEGQFSSLVSHADHRVSATRVVDATYMNVTVPSMRPPPYEVADAAVCLAPNELPRVAGQYQRYVVIGAGKTGMDACLFLLSNAVDPDNISWVMPRDSWMLDRANIQPGELFAESLGAGFLRQLEATVRAESVDDLLLRLEQCGQLVRLDENVRPTMYRCATVTQAEITQLRRIKNIVRLGHVQKITEDKIYLDQGDIEIFSDTLHVDCSADGLERRPEKAVFDASSITLQSVRTCQQVFSAAFIGHVESGYADQAVKNELCTPVPHPDSDVDFLRTSLSNMTNSGRWSQDPELRQWLVASRLDGFTAAGADTRPPPEAAMAAAQAAIANLHKLLS